MSLLPQNFPYIPIWISLFLIIITISFFRNKFKATQRNNIPPGPWKLPIIGNLHQLIGPLPHQLLSKLANKYGPIMHLQLGEVSAIIISSPESAKQVLKTNDLSFANRPNGVAAEIMSYGNLGIGFTPYSDYWRQMRKICVLELLSGKRVMSFRSIREEEVRNFVDFLTSGVGVGVNLSEKLFTLSNDIVARAAFGKKCKDQDELMSFVNEVRKVSGGFDIPDVFPSLKFFLGFVTGMVPLIPRESREECEINGYKIPNKTKILINTWAIGRDTSHWGEDVESFRPERFESSTKANIDFKGNSFELVPFGGGRRICPGISFGVAVVELVLSQLIYHFDWEYHGEDVIDDAVESFGITCRRKNDLVLIPTIPLFL